MSVFASGAIPPTEAIEWVCGQPNIESIVFGASSQGNIRNTAELVARHWPMRQASAKGARSDSILSAEEAPQGGLGRRDREVVAGVR